MTDLATLESWLAKLDLDVERDAENVFRVKARGDRAHAPFYVQWAENWVLLSILPLLTKNDFWPQDLTHRLLVANREMRVAKYALDAEGALVLCAELPTESLDFSELEQAVRRLLDYEREIALDLGKA